jgi:hypothetical protein
MQGALSTNAFVALAVAAPTAGQKKSESIRGVLVGKGSFPKLRKSRKGFAYSNDPPQPN